MPRIRRAEIHDSIRDEIKTTARRLMAEAGTAGLSLRAIARAMSITAPAIYTYFPTLDDLITALIVDAFTGLADAMKTARDAQPDATQKERLRAALYAWHDWAWSHRAEYLLIFGTPIAGYEAPREITVPAAVQIHQVITEPIEIALQSGEARPLPTEAIVPESERALLEALIAGAGYPVSTLAIYFDLVCFKELYGLVMGAMTGHYAPLTDAGFLQHEIAHVLRRIGFPP